jgi:magnesium transporter
VDLLRYPPDAAGGIMTNDVVAAPADWTVDRARSDLAEQLRAPDFVYYVYIVDDLETRRLRGVLTLRELLLADANDRLAGVMRPHLVAIDPLEPAASAAQRVADYNLAAIPVVGRDGRLLGAITADAVIDTLAPPAWRRVAPRVFT